jgi:hypothetical protein
VWKPETDGDEDARRGRARSSGEGRIREAVFKARGEKKKGKTRWRQTGQEQGTGAKRNAQREQVGRRKEKKRTRIWGLDWAVVLLAAEGETSDDERTAKDLRQIRELGIPEFRLLRVE